MGVTRDVTDACGDKVAVGDVVAVTDSYGRVSLDLAVVVGFTQSRALLLFKTYFEDNLGTSKFPARNQCGWAAVSRGFILTPQHRPKPEVLQWLNKTAQP